jgi:hypothetical protein
MRERRARITLRSIRLRISAVSSHFVAAGAFNLPDAVDGVPRVLWTGDSVLLEESYLSRFFAKFVEIVAAGFATACSAYLIAQLVGPPPAAVPTPAAVAVGSAVAGAPVQPALPGATAVADEQRSAPRPAADAAPAQPVPKAARTATSAPQTPAPKDVKTSTAAARGEKSAEALARAALANLDADRAVPADAPIRRASTAPVAAAPVEVVPRATELPPPRPADMPPPPAAAEAPPRHVAVVDPEIAAPRPETPAEEGKGLFSFPKRMLGLLRPGTPSLADEAPRPPLPVGTAARE